MRVETSVEDNKELARRYMEEAWNEGKVEALDALFSPDLAASLKPRIAAYRAALPDWRCTIHKCVAEADRVMHRWTGDATHTGEFLGITPTGKQITLAGMTIYLIEDGKIVSEWIEADLLGLLQQLGIMPVLERGNLESFDCDTWDRAKQGSVFANKECVRLYFEEVWNQGNTSCTGDYISGDIVVHQPQITGLSVALMDPTQLAMAFRAAMPDLYFINEDLFGERDRVVHRWSLFGTHTGAHLCGVPASQRQIQWTGINEFRMAEGKLTEQWSAFDSLSLAQQLGLIPPQD